MHTQREFTIAELEAATGQSRRTIHHYISRGLLPNAEGQGPAARYGRDHYLRLRLIDYASQAGFKIDKRLQYALDKMSAQEMEQLVERAEGSSTEDARSFGHWLLTGDPDAATPAMAVERYPAAVQAAHAPGSLRDRLPSTADFLRRAERRPVATSDPEQWERLRLGNDVELSWRPRYDTRFIERLRRLLQVAHELFGNEPPRRTTDEDAKDP